MARGTDPELIYSVLRCVADAHVEGQAGVVTDLGFSLEEACRLADCADQALAHLSRVRTAFLTLRVCPSGVDSLLDHIEATRQARLSRPATGFARTAQAALVLSLLHHVSQRIATGHLAPLLALGFAARQLSRLASLTVRDAHPLSGAEVLVLRATIDHARLHRLLERLERSRQEDEYIAALIQQGAPREMMRALFGLSNREFHLRRRLSGCSQKGGRPRAPTAVQSGRIWQAWRAHHRLELSERYLATARTTGLSLNLIWPLTQAWKAGEGAKQRPRGSRSDAVPDPAFLFS